MEEERIIQVYRECVHPLYGYVARRCGSDRTLAEDVTQETWLRAVAAWNRKGMPESPLAWLKTVARNLILNYFRRSPPVSLEVLPGDWEARYLGDGGTGDWEARPPRIGGPGDWESGSLGGGAVGKGTETQVGTGDGVDHGEVLSWGMARMKPAQARLIEAFHLDGLSVREIAEELKISERAVEGRLRRARVSLRKKLEPLLRSEGALQ
jgi:RNA polymerase sigma-70 factor (ECF subfamily)